MSLPLTDDERVTFPDNLTKDGAFRLANRVRMYWARKQVRQPSVWVEHMLISSRVAHGTSVYVVRSNMLDAVPRP